MLFFENFGIFYFDYRRKKIFLYFSILISEMFFIFLIMFLSMICELGVYLGFGFVSLIILFV